MFVPFSVCVLSVYVKVTLKNTLKTVFPSNTFCYIYAELQEQCSNICIPFPMNSLCILTAIWIQKIAMENGEENQRNLAGMIEQQVFNITCSLLGTRFWSEQYKF